MKPGRRPRESPSFPVIPAKAGIQGLIDVDSCFLPAFVGMTGNDGLKETIPLSFVHNQDHESPWIPAFSPLSRG